MNVLVLIGHQRPGSFCHAIADTAVQELKSLGHEVIFHDLYAEHFDPILPDSEIPRGSSLDPIVAQHCREVTAADAYLIVHPNWWAMPPAVLKGWIDRVWRQGVIYRFGPAGVESLVAGRKAVVFTTSNTPREDELRMFGDPLENLWKACVFNFVGIHDFVRRNFESIIMSTPEQRQAWLQEVRTIVRERFS
ncbi:MAG: NAD(P)H-dependent oxidoreductase [Planctomycetaceae bacterium]|nr:NAD(P)H-dependent oxidoreductase [Planctomycetaceae bacterium]